MTRSSLPARRPPRSVFPSSLLQAKWPTHLSQDLIWWFRERMETMNVTTWFHPSVSVFRGDFATHPGQPFPSPDEGDETIYEGDMLHTDVSGKL